MTDGTKATKVVSPDEEKRGGYSSGDRKVSELPKPPASVTTPEASPAPQGEDSNQG